MVQKYQFNHSLTENNFHCFQCLANINKADMNVPAQVLVFDEDNYNSCSMANSSCLEQRLSETGGAEVFRDG